ncbi:nitrogenase molybdenum-iron protein subunit beta [Planctomycetales bacterium]|nr:nitrogenase molybdenum-iron protein subunit beta [Planctomycetales bacterium]
MYAALGLHRCLPHSHGSQGCCAYHRSALTRHYNDPIMGSTSSFSEGASVFGGQANILEAITNIFKLYDPDIIAVNTTCLSEVIGDDLVQIIKKAVEEKKVPRGKFVIHANTPSFKGSHVTGYANMAAAMVQYFAKSTEKKHRRINLIPSFIEPSDMSEIKHLADEMGVKYTMFPDTSDVVNTTMDGTFRMYPHGGCRREWIESSGDAQATFAIGRMGALPAAKLLDTKCKVPLYTLDLPIGITATDAFVNSLRTVAHVAVPDSIREERGKLVDVLCDMNQYTYGKKVSLMGDPDIILSMVRFCRDIGMEVLHVLTGTPAGGKLKMEERIKEMCGPDVVFRSGLQCDLFMFEQLIKENKPDLVMGNTYCKYMCRDNDIPLLRVGFPIYDRIGHSYVPMMGYRGGMHLLLKILTILMDRQDRDAAEENVELIM